MFRGSRKHVLDWTDRPEFCIELLELVAPVPCRISAKSRWMPRGHRSPYEAQLETFGPTNLPELQIWPALANWWLTNQPGANPPKWDIAATCEIGGSAGLILVEAKAHEDELDDVGELIKVNASRASVEHHSQIGSAIEEACQALRKISDRTAISRDSHYQLSNSVAFAWKLASLGVPMVLVYLGFYRDEGITAPFKNEAHWYECFTKHADPVVPIDLFEKKIQCGTAPMWLLCRSRQILEMSET
jgi:hypothetical protein